MRILAAVIIAFALLAQPSYADDPPVVTTEPAQYAQTFADSMALAGVRPIREAFGELIGGTLPTDVDAALLTYERSITTLPARVSRVIEDITLSDTQRTIYLYHYYGDHIWLFTRLEFVAIGEGRWALSRVAFADRWSGIVLATTPGFRASNPAPPPRR